jgi:hypothetical protein
LSQGSKGRAIRKAEKRRLIRDEMVFIQGSAGFSLFDAKRHEEVMTVLYSAMTEMRKDTVEVRAVIGRTKTCYSIITKTEVDASRDSACSIRNKKYGEVSKETAFCGIPARHVTTTALQARGSRV